MERQRTETKVVDDEKALEAFLYVQILLVILPVLGRIAS